MNVEKKETAVTTSSKPWVQSAIDSGRDVPKWIADLDTEKEFLAMMDLRERAFPSTKRKVQ